MVDKVFFEHLDHVHASVYSSDSGIEQELAEFFTFDVPGAKFTPAFKNRWWDGKIRLYNRRDKKLYAGLLQYIQKFCEDREYEFESNIYQKEFSLLEAENFIKTLKIPPPIVPRDYQVDAFVHAVRNSRCLLLSPTSSGKSLIIYLLSRYRASQSLRTLIIVPTTSLVRQMYGDFAEYGFDSDRFMHMIYSGQDKQSKKPIVVTTWQSIYKFDKEWFDQFGQIIGDEAHLFKAKSLTGIMEKTTECEFKVGTTGTLDGTQTNKLVLEGLFGAVKKVTTTAELMEEGHVADLSIKIITLRHDDVICKMMKKADYKTEFEHLIGYGPRNEFIKNLAISLKGNSLILFHFVKKHGIILRDLIQASIPEGRNVYYIVGTGEDSVTAKEKEEIKRILETEKDAILLSSYKSFSTGESVKNLHNVIFASPMKGQISTLQSIGRGLRVSNTKTKATLYDIADDLSWKARKNHTILHLGERIKYYITEKFKYKIYNVKLK